MIDFHLRVVALGEGNCPRATDRGKEACECSIAVASGSILTKAARLRTETSYKAGAVRRVSPTSRSRSQSTVQVNDELAQRRITFLSGESWNPGLGIGFMPKARAKGRKSLGDSSSQQRP